MRDGYDRTPHLRKGEEVLWQGRPDGRWVLTWGMLLSLAFAVIFALFFRIFRGASSGYPSHIAVRFGLAGGVWVAYNAIFTDVIGHRRSRYAITPDRIMIATVSRRFTKGVKTIPITSDFPFELDMKHPASIVIGRELVKDNEGSKSVVSHSLRRISYGQHVYSLLVSIQKRLSRERS